MVNVTAVIFFGKSEKNIWVLDFFNYNHKYETVKQIKQIYPWNSITAITWNRATDLFVEQSNSYNVEQNHSYNVEQSNRTTAEQFITAKHLMQS